MIKIKPFRYWYYFRLGFTTYAGIIFAAINTAVVTYYLSIKDVPILKEIFPTFLGYLIILSVISVPLLVFVGFVHFKKTSAFHAEADIVTESNPYYFKLPPGYWKETFAPTYLLMLNLLVKITKNEKLTDDELKKITELQKMMNKLIQGGYVGNPAKSFSTTLTEEKEK